MLLVTRLLVAALTARAVTEYLTSGSYPRVHIEQGMLSGIIMESSLGRNFYAFRGIPYALPPVGHLRFRPPQEPVSWEEERTAWKEGNDCPQIHPTLMEYIGNEDCLYLNVYTPKLQGSSLSVMVWIHGGSFNYGSGSSELYGPQQLMDQNIVLVTFNYRLGALGFLSLEVPEMSGNYGMKDQVAVLRWVEKNIVNFGGNPKLVTIFGESAGATAIHFLMLSPLARGLFHRAIAQSGSVFHPWGPGKKPQELALQMASALGCTNTVMHCLKRASARKITEMEMKLRGEKYWKRMYQPSLEPIGSEDAFLIEHPEVLMARGEITNVPLMAGVTMNEGLQEYQYIGNRSLMQATKDSVSACTDLLMSGLERGSRHEQTVRNLVKHTYNELARGHLLDQFVLLNTDCEYVLGVDNLVREVAALQRSPVYYYLFSYDGNLGTLKRLTRVYRPGSVHTDDLGYLFPKVFLPPTIFANKNDYKTIKIVTKMWTDFAKTGHPTPDGKLGVIWKPIEAPTNSPRDVVTRHMDIGKRLEMKPYSLHQKRIEFWRNLLDEYTLSNTISRSTRG